MTQDIQSASYVHHSFVLVGVGSGSAASTAKRVAPYRLVLDPKTGLETTTYDHVPVGRIDGLIVKPVVPGNPPVSLKVSVSVFQTGLRLILNTRLLEHSSFFLAGSVVSDGHGATEYRLLIEDATLLSSPLVPRGVPYKITLSKGLPLREVSINSVEAWGSGAAQALAKVRPQDNCYTLNIEGISPDWLLSTAHSRGGIAIVLQRPQGHAKRL